MLLFNKNRQELLLCLNEKLHRGVLVLKKFIVLLVSIGVIAVGIRIAFDHDKGSASTLGQPTASFYEIDPRFREFYQRLGGEAVLGKGISPKFIDESGKEYQYVVTALLVYDHKATQKQKFYLAPIGRDLNIEEPARPAPEDPTILYRNGHYIYGPFVQVFNDFGGEAIVGEPLADPMFDPSRKITIQYFENLGFYQKESDPEGKVELLYYGLWKCGDACSFVPSKTEGNVDLYLNNDISFESYAEKLTKKITGKQLTGVQKGHDGLYEQVYENIVLVADPLIPGRVTLRPLTTILGYTPDPLQKPVSDARSFFFPVRNGWGYQVRDVIVDFIEPYGGVEFTGLPISEMKEKRPGLMEQCFENLCIEYAPYALFNKIRLKPLGEEYYSKFCGGRDTYLVFLPINIKGESVKEAEALPSEQAPVEQKESELVVYTWTAQALVPSGKQQIVGVGVYKNGVPVPDAEIHLMVNLPDGQIDEYSIGKTKKDGRIFVSMKPIIAPNGTRIVYHACIHEDGENGICAEEDYIIWGK